MKTIGPGRSAILGAAGLVGLCATSVACAEITFFFEEFTATGGQFDQINSLSLEGSLESADGDFVLTEEGENFTWADDLTVLVANGDLTDVLVQIGGYTDQGAAYRYAWPTGANGAAGTWGGGHIDTDVIDVSGYYLFLGNGYTPGGNGIWTGEISLGGSIEKVPAPGALALLGVGGALIRRRRN